MSERSEGELSTQDNSRAGNRGGEQTHGPLPQHGAEPDQQQASPQQQGDQQLGGPPPGSGGLVQDSQGFRERWAGIQGAFVDEPRQAVEQADVLVAEVIQHLTRSFAEERASLERQWAGGHSVSTEDLRVSLQRYRQFFQALLRD